MSYEIVTELRAIHALLEWQKTNFLQEQAKAAANDAQLKAEFIQLNNEFLERAKQMALEVQRQLRQEHEMTYHQVKGIVQ